MGSIVTIRHTLATAVANNGTVNLTYPSGYVEADLDPLTDYQLAVDKNDVYKNGAGVLVAPGVSNIVVTNQSGISWPAGSDLILTMGRTDRLGSYNLTIGTAYNQAAAGDGSNPNYAQPA